MIVHYAVLNNSKESVSSGNILVHLLIFNNMACKLKKNDINDTIENCYNIQTKRIYMIRQQIWVQQQNFCSFFYVDTSLYDDDTLSLHGKFS